MSDQPIKQACHTYPARTSLKTAQKQSTPALAVGGAKHPTRNESISWPANPSCGCYPQSLVRLTSRVVEALAAFALVTQPLPALAGEIIQGTPRVADGDTLQVTSSAKSQCI